MRRLIIVLLKLSSLNYQGMSRQDYADYKHAKLCEVKPHADDVQLSEVGQAQACSHLSLYWQQHDRAYTR